MLICDTMTPHGGIQYHACQELFLQMVFCTLTTI